VDLDYGGRGSYLRPQHVDCSRQPEGPDGHPRDCRAASRLSSTSAAHSSKKRAGVIGHDLAGSAPGHRPGAARVKRARIVAETVEKRFLADDPPTAQVAFRSSGR